MTVETITVLLEQRRELLRDLASLQIEARRCEQAIGHVEAAILLLDPDFEWATLDPTIRAADEVLFQPGEIPLLALAILSESKGGLSTAEIINRILERKGISRLSKDERRTVARRLHAVLSSKASEGVVTRVGRSKAGGMGQPACTIWELELCNELK